MGDPDLWPVIQAATDDELAVLEHLLGGDVSEDGTVASPPTPATRLRLHAELLLAGSHGIAALARRPTSWDLIVRRVAKHLRIEEEYVDLDDLERRVTARVIVAFVRALPDDQRAALDAAFLAGLPPETLDGLRELADGTSVADEGDFEAMALAMLGVDGEERRSWHDEGRPLLMRWLTGRAVRHRAGTVLVKFLGIGTGPLGMGLAAAVVAHDLAGPAMRKVVPAVMWAALARRT